MRLHVASIACGSLGTPTPTVHLSLPTDLFVITLYCDEALDCRQIGEHDRLEIAVSPMRSRPGRFITEGSGALATATLTPLGLLSVLRAPMAGLTDVRIPLDHFCGAVEQRRLRSAVMIARTHQERIDNFGRWLESRIFDSGPLTAHESRIAGAAMTLLHAPIARVDLTELARNHAITRRQLERDFGKWLGVSPAGYARLVRFQRAASALASGMSIVQVAAETGYSDQSHMTRVFRDTSWLTPRELAERATNPARRPLQAVFAGRVMMADSPLRADHCPAVEQQSADHSIN